MKKISISDVAEKAGVSKATVSLVLNNKESGIRISEKTRLKVLQAAKDLNYHPNYGARLLSTGRSCVIGVLTVNENMLFISDYDGRIMRGISAVAQESGYNIMILDEGIINKKMPFGENMIYNDFLDGILIISPDAKNETLIKIVTKIQKNGTPFVYLWRKGGDKNASVIEIDNISSAEGATDYLISLGHKRIGFISLGERSLSGKERLIGYKNSLKKHNIRFDEALIKNDVFKSFSLEKMINEQNLLEVFSIPDPPTALFAVFDPLAIGIIHSLQKRGVKIPNDISIMGFGNTLMARYSNPPLTTMDEPLVELGKQSARILIEQIEGKNKEIKKVVLKSQLIVRESCRTISI